MIQATLFGETSAKHLARRDDPPESRQAAEEILPVLGKLEAFAAKCVTDKPGLTRREYAEAFGMQDTNTIGRRLDGLVKKGFVRKGESRRCKVSNMVAATWWPVGVGDGARR